MSNVWPNGKPKSPEQLAYEARVKKSNAAVKAGPLGAIAQGAAGFIPGVGEAMDAKDAYDAWTAGDYATAAGIAGLGAIGLVPGVGDAIAGGARTARNLAKNRKQLGQGIKMLAEGNPNAKLAIKGAAGKGRQQTGPLSPILANYSARYGEHTPSQSAHIAANPKFHSADHRPDLSLGQKEAAGADVEYLLGAGRGKGGPQDKVWKNIDTAQGKRDFVQYADPDDNLMYFQSADGKVRQIPAGDVPYEQLGKEPDTIKTWLGRDDIPGQIKRTTPSPLGPKVKNVDTTALSNRAKKLWAKLEDGKELKKADNDWLESEGMNYLNRGGHVGPLGR